MWGVSKIIPEKNSDRSRELMSYSVAWTLLFNMLYLHHPPIINSKLLHTVKSIMAINQNRTNTMSDNCQQVGDCKYFHLQDTWKVWEGGGGEEVGLFDSSLLHSPLKKLNQKNNMLSFILKCVCKMKHIYFIWLHKIQIKLTC